jgi:pimeloyl-ACP methyl ester carboxylesterase
VERSYKHDYIPFNMPFLSIGYKRIHYADLNPQDGKTRETFIFMHGLGSSQNYYSAVAQSLVASGFRCITFDNTGAGRSTYTFVEQSIETLAEDVIGILDALDVKKAVFVGHSMGGYVSISNLLGQKKPRNMRRDDTKITNGLIVL